jgi:hypothetical protein
MNSTRVHEKVSGALIISGSLSFLFGGAQHPKINSSLGVVGSAEFFDNFYMHIQHHGSWELIHSFIMAGPILWLLGMGVLWTNRNGWTETARTAMTMAATAWAVVFVFDGFVASYIVRSATAELGHTLLAVNQQAVIRLGLVSWLVLSVSIVASSIGWLVENESLAKKVIAGLGLVVGVWPFIAWATGLFLPGPFTSHYWTATAIITANWFIAVGTSVLLRNRLEAHPTRIPMPAAQVAG